MTRKELATARRDAKRQQEEDRRQASVEATAAGQREFQRKWESGESSKSVPTTCSGCENPPSTVSASMASNTGAGKRYPIRTTSRRR